ncbi:protein of unknown function [Agreia sp. COWG]|nr:protein of unknown function [Agreia sp. COWG]
MFSVFLIPGHDLLQRHSCLPRDRRPLAYDIEIGVGSDVRDPSLDHLDVYGVLCSDPHRNRKIGTYQVGIDRDHITVRFHELQGWIRLQLEGDFTVSNEQIGGGLQPQCSTLLQPVGLSHLELTFNVPMVSSDLNCNYSTCEKGREQRNADLRERIPTEIRDTNKHMPQPAVHHHAVSLTLTRKQATDLLTNYNGTGWDEETGALADAPTTRDTPNHPILDILDTE